MSYKNMFIIGIVIFLVLPLIFGFNIKDTTFKATGKNYTIYIEKPISLDKIVITGKSMKFYNLSNGGKFENPNLTYDSVISFYGLKYSDKDDIKWDNGTFIYNVNNINITIPPDRYIEIVSKAKIEKVPSRGGGGGGYESPQIKEVMKAVCENLYWMFIETKGDYNSTDVEEIRIEINNKSGAYINESQMESYFNNFDYYCEEYGYEKPERPKKEPKPSPLSIVVDIGGKEYHLDWWFWILIGLFGVAIVYVLYWRFSKRGIVKALIKSEEENLEEI